MRYFKGSCNALLAVFSVLVSRCESKLSPHFHDEQTLSELTDRHPSMGGALFSAINFYSFGGGQIVNPLGANVAVNKD